ncbi:MAG: TAXI family TRAP transporter solute-binding subunit [Thermodesulfobacteriota bacterium]|nr:TAXI family TRAP transporter solute-binding subunit [Thermodesulfobacteriota bacterium]
MKAQGNFKKTILVGVVFIFTFIFSSSGALAQRELVMPLGGVTGSFYIIGAAVAKFVNDHSKNIKITPSTSGGGVENVRRIEPGTAHLGMTMPETMYQAWHGEKPFDKSMRNWRVIGVSTEVMANHVASLAHYNVMTILDLKGRTFAIGAPGSGAAVGMNLFLEHIGLKKDLDARMLPHADYPTMLLDGKIHAFNRLGAAPAAAVEEVAVHKKIALVDCGPEMERSGFLKKYPYYQKVLIKGGTYKGEDRDVTFFGSAGFFIAHKDLPEDLVYEFTKLAYSDEAIKAVTMVFKGHNLNRKDPFEGNIGPIHPGAAKFWKEVGVHIPEPVLK